MDASDLLTTVYPGDEVVALLRAHGFPVLVVSEFDASLAARGLCEVPRFAALICREVLFVNISPEEGGRAIELAVRDQHFRDALVTVSELGGQPALRTFIAERVGSAAQ